MSTKMIETKAPENFAIFAGFRVFLAGSIEMGKAVNWQAEVKEKLEKFDVHLLNPRRDDWDSSWEQSIDNDKFREQVEWELKAMENCDTIFMYLAPGTKSPISLLELGLNAREGNMIVVCPKEFWRRGNVEIVCKRYGILFFEDIDTALESLITAF